MQFSKWQENFFSLSLLFTFAFGAFTTTDETSKLFNILAQTLSNSNS